MNAIRKLYSAFELAAPGSNTSFAAFTPFYTTSFVRIAIRPVTGTVVNLIVTSGATSVVCGLNASTVVAAGDLKTFDPVPVHSEFSYALQVETDGVISYVSIVELEGCL